MSDGADKSAEFERGFLAAQRRAEKIAMDQMGGSMKDTYDRMLGWNHCAAVIASAIAAMKPEE